jgi:hypothetical protein
MTQIQALQKDQIAAMDIQKAQITQEIEVQLQQSTPTIESLSKAKQGMLEQISGKQAEIIDLKGKLKLVVETYNGLNREISACTDNIIREKTFESRLTQFEREYYKADSGDFTEVEDLEKTKDVATVELHPIFEATKTCATLALTLFKKRSPSQEEIYQIKSLMSQNRLEHSLQSTNGQALVIEQCITDIKTVLEIAESRIKINQLSPRMAELEVQMDLLKSEIQSVELAKKALEDDIKKATEMAEDRLQKTQATVRQLEKQREDITTKKDRQIQVVSTAITQLQQLHHHPFFNPTTPLAIHFNDRLLFDNQFLSNQEMPTVKTKVSEKPGSEIVPQHFFNPLNIHVTTLEGDALLTLEALDAEQLTVIHLGNTAISDHGSATVWQQFAPKDAPKVDTWTLEDHPTPMLARQQVVLFNPSTDHLKQFMDIHHRCDAIYLIHLQDTSLLDPYITEHSLKLTQISQNQQWTCSQLTTIPLGEMIQAKATSLTKMMIKWILSATVLCVALAVIMDYLNRLTQSDK